MMMLKIKMYSVNFGVSSDKWHFVTGNIDSIYSSEKVIWLQL